MFSHALGVFVGWLAVVSARETIRPLPTITNSLVNLGKMDISFYFNGNGKIVWIGLSPEWAQII